VLTNTNVVGNNPKLTIQQYAKTKAAALFNGNNKHTSFSQKNKNKSSEVTLSFINIRYDTIRYDNDILIVHSKADTVSLIYLTVP